MRRFARWAFAVLSLAVASPAIWAQEACYEYNAPGVDGTPASGWQTSQGAALGALAPSTYNDFGSCQLNYNYTYTITAPPSPPGSGGSFSVSMTTVVVGGTCGGHPNTNASYASGNFSIRSAACPPPPDCDMDACPVGTHLSATGGAAEVCNTDCNCKLTKSGSTGGITTYHNTGENCGDAPDAPEDLTENDGDEACTSVGDGEYCASSDGDGQCGYMNDTYVCLQDVKNDECKTLGDGGRVCGNQAASTPPVPDSGTPGELAAPDGTINQELSNPDGSTTNNTYNYYNGGTVAGSSRDPGTTGASGASTAGSPHAPTPGDENGDGEDDCVGSTCGSGTPELADIPTTQEAFGNYWDELQAVPLVAAAAEVAPSFGSGSCPDWSDSVDVYGNAVEMDFSSICTTWEDVSPVLTIVMLVFWGLLALRILLSA